MKPKIIAPVLGLNFIVAAILLGVLLRRFNFIRFPFNLIGLVIIFWGFSILGKARQLFLKHNTPHTFDDAKYLITEGPFRYSRHPMYLGMLIILTGAVICSNNIFSLVLPLLFFLIINYWHMPYEEKQMEEIFGEKYLYYRNSVRKWF